MKPRRVLFSVCIMLLGLMLCAFYVYPTVSFSNENLNVDMAYLNAESDLGTMTVDVNFDSNGEMFEIIRDIKVYSDSNLSNQLKLKACAVEGDKYVYTFETNGKTDIKQIYLEPPVLYAPDSIETISAIAVKNSILKDANGDNWFKINGVKIVDVTDEDIQLNMVITPYTSTIPRFPELVVGNKVYGGATAMEFDENGNFVGGEIIFLLPLDSMSTLSTGKISEGNDISLNNVAMIKVSDVLTRVEADNKAFSSNVKNLSVVESAEK